MEAIAPSNAEETLVLAFFTALNSGNLEAIRPFFTADTVWRPMVRDMTEKPEYRGDAIIDDFLGPIRSVFRPGDPLVTVTALISKGDSVAVESTGTGEMRDGKPYDNRYGWVFRLKDGKIARIHEYLDSYYVARLLGMTAQA